VDHSRGGHDDVIMPIATSKHSSDSHDARHYEEAQ
jgi:hypothetical protein